MDFYGIESKGKLALAQYANVAALPTPVVALTGVLAYTIDTGDVYKCNGSAWSIIGSGGGGASTLNDLTDVSTVGATSGQVIKYNGATWAPAADTSGGSGTTMYEFDFVGGTSSFQNDPAEFTCSYSGGSQVITIDHTIAGGAVLGGVTAIKSSPNAETLGYPLEYPSSTGITAKSYQVASNWTRFTISNVGTALNYHFVCYMTTLDFS